MFKYALLALLAFGQQCGATIIDMREFYNPEFKQTIILCGDMHLVLGAIDAQQSKEVVNAIKYYNAPAIIEHDPRFPIEWLRKLTLADLKKTQCLTQILWLSLHNWLEIYCPDFRVVSRDCDLPELLSADELSRKILGIGRNNLAIIEEIRKYEQQIPGEDKLWIDYFNTQAISYAADIKKMFVVNSWFGLTAPKESNVDILHYLSAMGSLLFDARIMTHIHAKRSKSVLFVVAGGAHTDRIAQNLDQMGYVQTTKILHGEAAMEHFASLYGKYNSKNCLDEEEIQQSPELWMSRAEQLEKSPEMVKYGVNIAKFLKGDATLPLEPDVYNLKTVLKYIVLASLIGAGTIGAVISFSTY